MSNLPQRRALDRIIRPTRAEVDLRALEQNLRAIREIAPKVAILAVVKANAYGHGAVPVAQALERQGVDMLAVSLVEEGLELRNARVKSPIVVLGGAYQGGYDTIVEHDLIPTVFRAAHFETLAAIATANSRNVKVHLKVDTGMGRIGVQMHELEPLLDVAARYPNVQIEGLLSHFANADLADLTMTENQIRRFQEALATLRRRGIDPKWRHLANSAGVLALPQVRDGAELNLVRPGLMLYGIAPAPWLEGKATLTPVLSWKTAVTHVKHVAKGTPVSYGSIWTAPRDSVIAVLPVGYADGYNRHYSSHAEVLVRGTRAEIAGRVCMDMCMIDVTEIPGVSVGDEVVLLGSQGQETISAQELAQLADTISYEVLCAIGARVPRRLLGAPDRKLT